MVMAPPAQPQPSSAPAPDMQMPPQAATAAPGMSPPANVGTSEPDGGPTPPEQDQQSSDGTQAVQQRLDALPDHDKKFLAQYLTPEFVYAIGLVSGPEAAQYLGQFTDKNKVLVPVSRQEAERIQATVKQNQQGQQTAQPQGQPQAAQPQQAAPAMKPQPMPQMPQQPLPNGVTPAPMAPGIMAPQG